MFILTDWPNFHDWLSLMSWYLLFYNYQTFEDLYLYLFTNIKLINKKFDNLIGIKSCCLYVYAYTYIWPFSSFRIKIKIKQFLATQGGGDKASDTQ